MTQWLSYMLILTSNTNENELFLCKEYEKYEETPVVYIEQLKPSSSQYTPLPMSHNEKSHQFVIFQDFHLAICPVSLIGNSLDKLHVLFTTVLK